MKRILNILALSTILGGGMLLTSPDTGTAAAACSYTALAEQAAEDCGGSWVKAVYSTSTCTVLKSCCTDIFLGGCYWTT
jgi:hypothetical protein